MSTRLTLCDTSGPLIDLIQKLSGEEGEMWLRCLKRMLRKENPREAVTAPDFQAWKTIKLGTGLKTAPDFLTALNEQKFQTSNWAKNILGKLEFTVVAQETEIDLVVVTVAELGFPKSATRQDIYQRAQKLGLDLCPAEVGPQLRIQYKDQPKGESLLIGMEPITNSDGDLRVFRVVHDDEDLWLNSCCGSPDIFWGADRRWVFLRRKPARNA